MKKYRLKKWYPSLPFEWKLYKSEVILKFDGRKYIGDIHYLNKNEVENNPEFWEEVVKKEYEILSFKYNRGIVTRNEINRSTYGRGQSKKENSEILNLTEIYSVRRLSDGKVFTVGDIVKTINSTFKITKIVQDDAWGGGLFVESRNESKIPLKHIQPYKQPLFTTEDGVDLYEGDKCYVVDKNTLQKAHYTMAEDTEQGALYIPHKNIYFSTRLKAILWIEENELKYSEGDIKKTLNNFSFSEKFKKDFFNNLNNK